MKRLFIIISFLCISLLATGAAVSLLILTASSAYAHTGIMDQTLNTTLPVKSDGSIWVNNVAGSVKIKGWAKQQIQVTGTLVDGVTLDFHKASDGAEIRVVYPENESNHAEADLIINVPIACRLSVNTVSANIDASGLNGAAQLESVSGDVTIKSNDSDISAKSVSGEVNVLGSTNDAHVKAHSISGDVKVDGVGGDLQAESVSGTTKVVRSRLNRAQMGSTSGNVDFTGALQKDGSYTFNSISGNLTLQFLAVPDARFDISSFSGDIDNSFGPKAQHTSEYGPGMELHFVSGKGNAQVNARTLSGNITLRTP
jgi:DUF4097 and DUF4098 domain-containing protein YvlB